MNLQVFYHCALMPGALPIAKEQVSLAAWLGLPNMSASLLGPKRDRDAIQKYADSLGVPLSVRHEADGFGEYEYPTITELWNSARLTPGDAFLYWHTKGASKGFKDLRRRHWRRVMQKWVISQWREFLALMETHDVAGANYLPKAPHMSGNFWMARGDWIAETMSPRDYAIYRTSHTPRHSRRWALRYHAEAWICHRPGVRVYTSVCRDIRWGHGRHLLSISSDIPGFQYNDSAYTSVAPINPTKGSSQDLP